MKNNKGKSILGLLIVILVIAACGFVAFKGVDESGQGSVKNIKLGLDLAGGVSITYEAEEENPSAEDMHDTVYKLQKRVESYSTEAEVYQEGNNRINVEIPGEYDSEKILEELGNPGTVQFMEISEPANTDGETAEGSETQGVFNLVMDGNDIADAQVMTQPDSYGNQQYVVSLTLTSDGAQKFKEATERNIGKPIYIVYDNEIISYPTVNTVIENGQAVIEGNFTYESANNLATYIRLGALKLNLNEIRSNVVGAKLGDEALSTSLKAGAIGLALIIVFMIVMYLIPGVAAGLALLLYVAAMLCLLNGLDVTLTLPGIAGIILSIGMAVDANVIIFTRIREEIAAGRNVREAIKTGFTKARSAILDGNITTLIAAAVLYMKGSGTIKGFAITLALGIVLSMFTALVITHFIVNILYGLGFTSEKFYGKQKKRKVFPFVQKAKIFYIISAVVIIAGFVGMGLNHSKGSGAMNYSLDFTGGTSMNVTFNEMIDVTGSDGAELLKNITDTIGTGDVQLQNVKETNDIVIKTPVLDKDQRSALKDALTEKYGVDEKMITEQSISAVVSDEMQKDAVLAVVIAGICMLIYIWFRFKDVKFGASAVLALLHDVLCVLTVYALVRIPVGNTFIACMLTIVGYSINATIVIFDRIRENRQVMYRESLDEIVNASISQTLSRSINTSVTTFIAVFVLWILGVASIREFALPLMAGIIFGAYSSIFITGTLWYALKKLGKKN
ncbi:protein translocase subunit SecD [Frisingicoccus sp.]|uniref:protein translocase subunit SecD n=1 Tax=Frisingicoccus sp. TaxID=1918627 RepID=UPI0015C12622|nr:protein translocase subunit SecD [Frisingicoccus sp.]MEE0751789.1 protein translocase subunit SecD [Frisingicoccus sp.]